MRRISVQDIAFDFRISIHAPVKGATDYFQHLFHPFLHFNPRTREGCDFLAEAEKLKAKSISIHAPVKGATNKPTEPAENKPTISIHAPVKGATFWQDGVQRDE